MVLQKKHYRRYIVRIPSCLVGFYLLLSVSHTVRPFKAMFSPNRVNKQGKSDVSGGKTNPYLFFPLREFIPSAHISGLSCKLTKEGWVKDFYLGDLRLMLGRIFVS